MNENNADNYFKNVTVKILSNNNKLNMISKDIRI